MDEETVRKVLKWGAELLTPNGLNFVDTRMYEVASIIFSQNLVSVMLSLVTVGESMKGAFMMGVAWQKFLDSEEGRDLNSLLKDVKID